MFSLFHDSWNAFPTFAILDHTMTVRAKPWTLDNNSNTSSCDGTNTTMPGFAGGSTTSFIQSLLDECGTLCEPCQDTTDTDGDGIGDDCDDCHNLAGDVNDDFEFNVLDIVVVVDMILSGGISSPNHEDCAKVDADIDLNGEINILDVIRIINLILDNRNFSELIDGTANIEYMVEGNDLNIVIDSDVDFSGVQLSLKGNYLVSLQNEPTFISTSKVNSGVTTFLSYSLDNNSFFDKKVILSIEGAAKISKNDIDLIVSDLRGQQLSIVGNIEHSSYVKPSSFGISNIFPNPFNPITEVKYSLETDGNMKLSVFNLKGNEMDIIFEGFQKSGLHSNVWDATQFPSGVYYIQLTSNGKVENIKAVLLK